MLHELMTAEDLEATGVDSLSVEKRQALHDWVQVPAAGHSVLVRRVD